MKYLEFHFNLTPASSDFVDVLEGVLADVGFDSFVKSDDAIVSPSDARGLTGDVVFTERGDMQPTSATTALAQHALTAYVPASAFDEDTFQAALAAFPVPGVSITYTKNEVEDRDWNAEWEQNYFTPLDVDGRCVVSATFHRDVPQAEYNIVINPRMSFGTGHHETTRQMLRAILHADLEGRDVLDMGCGTSILAILAAKRGAHHVTAIDIDEWCVANSLENIALNGISNVEVHLGDASQLPATPTFDVVLANIHLNIITADLPAYVRAMRPGGLLLTSGFYADDLPRLRTAAEACGLRFVRATEENRWCCASFQL